MTRLNRRHVLGAALVGGPTVLVSLGVRAAQQDAGSTPTASPEASPSASPGASPVAGGEAIQIHTVDIRFEPDTFSIPADTDTEVEITNKGVLQHDFAIDELDILTELLDSEESVTITINAPAGTYEYYCTVPGHKEAGMVGTLTVE